MSLLVNTNFILNSTIDFIVTRSLLWFFALIQIWGLLINRGLTIYTLVLQVRQPNIFMDFSSAYSIGQPYVSFLFKFCFSVWPFFLSLIKVMSDCFAITKTNKTGKLPQPFVSQRFHLKNGDNHGIWILCANL